MAENMSIAAKAEVKSSKGVGSKQWAAGIRKKAKELAKESEDVFMRLGKVLYIIWDTPADGSRTGQPLFERWGFDTFPQYVETELNMDRRRAQRLRKIWYNLEVECEGISPELKEDLIKLGSTKLRELGRVMDTDNAQYWHDTVKDINSKMTTEVVNDYLDRQSTKVGRFEDETDDPAEDDEVVNPGQPLNENFKLYPPQQRNLKEAITTARLLADNPKAKKGHCLDLICMDFLATNDIKSKDTEASRERYLAKMETALGLKIIAIDPEGDIVHGTETLEALARKVVD
jgi:hypothetical protein